MDLLVAAVVERVLDARTDEDLPAFGADLDLGPGELDRGPAGLHRPALFLVRVEMLGKAAAGLEPGLHVEVIPAGLEGVAGAVNRVSRRLGKHRSGSFRRCY
jgi:hypothetical protein